MTRLNEKELREFFILEKKENLRASKIFVHFISPILSSLGTLLILAGIFWENYFYKSTIILGLLIDIISIFSFCLSRKNIEKLNKLIEENK